MVKIEKLFDKKILISGIVAIIIITILLLSDNFYRIDELGEIKFYSDYLLLIQGVYMFYSFMIDKNFKLKYYILMCLNNRCIYWLVYVIIYKVFYPNISIELYIFILCFIQLVIINPILYQSFKTVSYNKLNLIVKE